MGKSGQKSQMIRKYARRYKEKLKRIQNARYGCTINEIRDSEEYSNIMLVYMNGLYIEHIKEPTEIVQLVAVQQNGLAIEHIKDPTERVQLAAVRQNKLSSIHIRKPTKKVKAAISSERGYKAFDMGFTCKGYKYKIGRWNKHRGEISLCGSGLHYCERLSDIFYYYRVNSEVAEIIAQDVSDEAGRDSKRVCRRLKITNILTKDEIYEELLRERGTERGMIEKNADFIYFIKDQTEELQLAAVNKRGRSIEYIDCPTSKVILASIEKNSNDIQNIYKRYLNIKH